MRKIILFSVIQQLLYHISRVESLIGVNFIPIRGGEFPFIASFQHFPGENNFCGGALISEKHVLTIPSCLVRKTLASFRILFEVAHAGEPAVAYRAASWITYADWAETQRIPHDRHGLAVVTLADRVYTINPVAINGLTKRQLDGTAAIMTGWKNDVLSKTTVQVLSDEDSQRNVRLLRNSPVEIDPRVLSTFTNPFALLDTEDIGCPLLDARDNSLLGIGFAFVPGDEYVRGNFSTEFIRQHQVNLHFSIRPFRVFIHSVAPAVPGA